MLVDLPAGTGADEEVVLREGLAEHRGDIRVLGVPKPELGREDVVAIVVAACTERLASGGADPF